MDKDQLSSFGKFYIFEDISKMKICPFIPLGIALF